MKPRHIDPTRDERVIPSRVCIILSISGINGIADGLLRTVPPIGMFCPYL
jgi:hypothetical protein